MKGFSLLPKDLYFFNEWTGEISAKRRLWFCQNTQFVPENTQRFGAKNPLIMHQKKCQKMAAKSTQLETNCVGKILAVRPQILAPKSFLMVSYCLYKASALQRRWKTAEYLS